MTVLERLESELKTAMKAKDSTRLGAIRLIKTTVKNKEIELIRPLTEAEFMGVLTSMAKKVKESIEQFTNGGRTELAEKEKAELAILETFLPKALSEDELAAMIQDAIVKSGAKGPKDMGAVMKELKEPTAGRTDGKALADKVRAKLSSI